MFSTLRLNEAHIVYKVGDQKFFLKISKFMIKIYSLDFIKFLIFYKNKKILRKKYSHPIMCVGTLVENFQHGLVSYRKAF
jgi:hypothetical protein